MEKMKGIEGLESRPDFDSTIKNEVEVKEGDKTIVYVGEAIDLYFQDLYSHGYHIRGGARLTRHDRKIEKKRKLVFSKFRPKIEVEEIPKTIDEKVWSVTTNYNHNYFIYHGKTEDGYDCNADYRANLKAKAVNEEIMISHQIFEAVFNPIDKELMSRYHKVTKRGGNKMTDRNIIKDKGDPIIIGMEAMMEAGRGITSEEVKKTIEKVKKGPLNPLVDQESVPADYRDYIFYPFF